MLLFKLWRLFFFFLSCSVNRSIVVSFILFMLLLLNQFGHDFEFKKYSKKSKMNWHKQLSISKLSVLLEDRPQKLYRSSENCLLMRKRFYCTCLFAIFIGSYVNSSQIALPLVVVVCFWFYFRKIFVFVFRCVISTFTLTIKLLN